LQLPSDQDASGRSLGETELVALRAVIDSGTLTLASGEVRTAMAVDAAGGGAPFDLLVLADLN